MWEHPVRRQTGANHVHEWGWEKKIRMARTNWEINLHCPSTNSARAFQSISWPSALNTTTIQCRTNINWDPHAWEDWCHHQNMETADNQLTLYVSRLKMKTLRLHPPMVAAIVWFEGCHFAARRRSWQSTSSIAALWTISALRRQLHLQDSSNTWTISCTEYSPRIPIVCLCDMGFQVTSNFQAIVGVSNTETDIWLRFNFTYDRDQRSHTFCCGHDRSWSLQSSQAPSGQWSCKPEPVPQWNQTQCRRLNLSE